MVDVSITITLLVVLVAVHLSGDSSGSSSMIVIRVEMVVHVVILVDKMFTIMIMQGGTSGCRYVLFI